MGSYENLFFLGEGGGGGGGGWLRAPRLKTQPLSSYRPHLSRLMPCLRDVPHLFSLFLEKCLFLNFMWCIETPYNFIGFLLDDSLKCLTY